MTSFHPAADLLARYVIGALEPGDVARIDRHVSACPACTAALCGEARLEMRLRAVVDELGREAPDNVVPLPGAASPRRARPRPGFANGFAAAAALSLGVWGLGAARGPAGPVVGAGGVAQAAPLVCELVREEALCRGPAPLLGGQSPAGPEDRLDGPAEGNLCRAPRAGVCRWPPGMP